MTSQATFALHGRNPDILTCIANLSNDEVFTPPEIANRMLDGVERAWSRDHDGASLWSNSAARFLDPFTKSGVFLREITKRLVDGLEEEIPDLDQRVDHILTKQVFGIAITELTALLARRSVYCSKWADGPHSIARSFLNADGNVWFERTEHLWAGTRCSYCGTPKSELDRGGDLESHAYAFIHTKNISGRVAEMFGENMEFDVIIGNPPYQLSDGGHSASAVPIYHKFVDQSIALEPRLLCMVIPSRWFGGGRGLDSFRARMLADRRLRAITDFVVEKDAFPGVNINGGVNFFLWDRDNPGDCLVQTVAPGGIYEDPVERPLDEFDIFVRRNPAISILRKVRAKREETFDTHVSSLKPFGLRTHFHGADKSTAQRNIKFHGSGKTSWIARDEIAANEDWVDMWKVLVARATDGNENYPLPIWDQAGPFVAGPGEACSETYLVAARTKSKAEAKKCVAYMDTKFFRFLVSLRKFTQDNKADAFSFVPNLPLDRVWTDELLNKRYELSQEEVEYIDSMIRSVDFTNDK